MNFDPRCTKTFDLNSTSMFELVDDETLKTRENYFKVVLQMVLTVKNAIVWFSPF